MGRALDPARGPCVVMLRDGAVIDVTSPEVPTIRDLLERDDPAGWLRTAEGRSLCTLAEIVGRSRERGEGLRLLAPCDLQALKACGVTFARSMVERVIEERAAGDPAKAEAVRGRIAGLIGASLRDIVPGQRGGRGGQSGATGGGPVEPVPRSRHRA